MDQTVPLPSLATEASDEATIFALASGPGRGAVAILRIAGPRAAALLACLCLPPPPRRASLRTLKRPRTGEILDRALVLWFPGPSSYTGGDCVELHLHGGRAVIEAVSEALVGLGARPAEPGEFTRRAFLNGRMDLLEAEAIADLVAAQSDAQRRQALRQLEGELGDLYRGWAETLRRLVANAEAMIDFSDQDLPEPTADAGLVPLRAAIARHLADERRGERIREGLVIVVAGAANAGKSSLVNALARRDLAIVSPIPGTTRDALEARIVIGGVPLTLIDTAGLRESANPIEREGVRRAQAAIGGADLVLAVTDAAAPLRSPSLWERDGVRAPAPVLAIANKVDLAPPPPGMFAVSALTGAGIDGLRARIADFVADLTSRAGPPPLTRARHRAALIDAERALATAATASAPELRAEELRRALAALGRITGAVGVEDLLDTIFSNFCIGK